MNVKLNELNQAAKETAETAFLNCCGSQTWARKMVEARPFNDVAALINQAERIWRNLDAQDWLEAFAAHPKIGAKKAASKQQRQSAEWSKSEQSGTQTADELILEELARANSLYERKFGYIFIVCATGKTAEEMLALCQARLKNSDVREIQIAADEQKKITEIRLKKLLEIE